jgi:hypothetical protein
MSDRSRGTYPADLLCEEYGIKVVDPEGWTNRSVPWSEPITRYEFLCYASESAVEVCDQSRYKAFFHLQGSRFPKDGAHG